MDEFALDMDTTLDRFQTTLDREYDLALHADPPPSILTAEVALATEGWRLVDTVAVLYATVDDLQTTADAARFALARLALETLPAYTTYQQPALPPPPDSFDDGDPTEDFSGLTRHASTLEQRIVLPVGELEEGPLLARRVGGWWPRLRGWGRQLRAATTLLLAGVA
jgi:hypothetical protein